MSVGGYGYFLLLLKASFTSKIYMIFFFIMQDCDLSSQHILKPNSPLTDSSLLIFLVHFLQLIFFFFLQAKFSFEFHILKIKFFFHQGL